MCIPGPTLCKRLLQSSSTFIFVYHLYFESTTSGGALAQMEFLSNFLYCPHVGSLALASHVCCVLFMCDLLYYNYQVGRFGLDSVSKPLWFLLMCQTCVRVTQFVMLFVPNGLPAEWIIWTCSVIGFTTAIVWQMAIVANGMASSFIVMCALVRVLTNGKLFLCICCVVSCGIHYLRFIRVRGQLREPTFWVVRVDGANRERTYPATIEEIALILENDDVALADLRVIDYYQHLDRFDWWPLREHFTVYVWLLVWCLFVTLWWLVEQK